MADNVGVWARGIMRIWHGKLRRDEVYVVDVGSGPLAVVR